MKKFRLCISAVCCIACLLSIHAFAATGFIAYNEGNNANDGLTAATAKKQFLSFEENGVLSVIGEEGGTMVIVERAYIGGNFAFPAMSGPLTITAKYNGVSYLNASNKDNPTGGMLKAASDRVITLGTDTTFTDMILFQEAGQNTLVVPSGMTLTMTDTVRFMTKPGNDYHWKIFVSEGATAILSKEALDTLEIVNRGGTVKIYGSNAVWTGNEIEIKMTVNKSFAFVGDQIKMLDASPIIRNSRTMLPVRFVAEQLGATVDWNGETSTATITGANGAVIAITIGASEAQINSETVALDSPAFIESSRTYLPVRFVAEALGAYVSWDGATSTATILGVPKGTTQAEHSQYYIEGLSADQVVLYFTEVCLDVESALDVYTPVIHKWERPIYCAAFGKGTEEDLEVMNGFLKLVNAIPGFPGMYGVADSKDANLAMNFFGWKDFAENVKKLGMDPSDLGGVTFPVWDEQTNEITFIVIYYRSDLTQERRSPILLHELFQSLGIFQDTRLRTESINYEYGTTVSKLTDIDLLILKLLYDPKIKCGMDAVQCEYIIRELYY